MAKRAASMRNAGSVLPASSSPRKVEPHTMYTVASPPAMASREGALRQAITESERSSRFRFSQPCSVTSTMSSSRTPPKPAR